MKKFCVIVLAVLFVAGIVSEVVAEDRLKLSGAFRARAWYWENAEDYDNNNDADKLQYFDQRLRIAGRITAAEGISANFRVDLSEAQWGQQTGTSRGGGSGWNRANPGTPTIQVDRANVRIDREMFTLSVGLDYPGIGLDGNLYSSNQFGAIFRLKTPVVFDLIYNKLDENSSLTDTDIAGVNTEDTDLFGAQANYKRDNWSAGIGGAMFNDNSNVDDSPWGIAIWGASNFGPLDVSAELSFFGGSVGNTDYKGTQIYANGQYNIMSNLFVGAHIWWAQSQDGGDRQITGLSDGGDPLGFADLGPFYTDILPLEGLNDLLGARQVTPEFDPSGQSAGAIGGTIYGGWRFMEPLLLEAQYLYVTPEDSGQTPLNYVNLVGLCLTYDWMPNTKLAGAWNWHLPDIDNMQSDAANILVGRIEMTF